MVGLFTPFCTSTAWRKSATHFKCLKPLQTINYELRITNYEFRLGLLVQHGGNKPPIPNQQNPYAVGKNKFKYSSLNNTVYG